MQQPDAYVVIGNPVGHSKSPWIHAAFAAQTAQQMQYNTLEAPLDDFAGTVRKLMDSGARGANVTVPFKLEAFALADSMTARARAAGAVNTLLFQDGRILADNTDGIGLVTDIVQNAACSLRGKRVLMLGAGGAARGALLPLAEQAPAALVIANRTLARAQDLLAVLHSDAPDCVAAASTFADLQGPFDVIINATSASLHGELPPLPAGLMHAETLAYDMMYGAQETPFCRYAREQGAQTRDGLGMLVEQAAEAFYLWRQVRPQTTAVLAELRTMLQKG